MKVISEVQIMPVKPNNGLVGFASFVLYEAVYCGSVGVFTRPHGGYRLVYPTRKILGKDINVYYPISRQVGRAIEEAVANKFEDVVSKDNGRHDCLEPRMAYCHTNVRWKPTTINEKRRGGYNGSRI